MDVEESLWRDDMLWRSMLAQARGCWPVLCGGVVLRAREPGSTPVSWLIPNVAREPRHSYLGQADATTRAYDLATALGLQPIFCWEVLSDEADVPPAGIARVGRVLVTIPAAVVQQVVQQREDCRRQVRVFR